MNKFFTHPPTLGLLRWKWNTVSFCCVSKTNKISLPFLFNFKQLFYDEHSIRIFSTSLSNIWTRWMYGVVCQSKSPAARKKNALIKLDIHWTQFIHSFHLQTNSQWHVHTAAYFNYQRQKYSVLFTINCFRVKMQTHLHNMLDKRKFYVEIYIYIFWSDWQKGYAGFFVLLMLDHKSTFWILRFINGRKILHWFKSLDCLPLSFINARTQHNNTAYEHFVIQTRWNE